MKRQKQLKKQAIFFFIVGILLLSASALAGEQSIELIDVSVGETQEESACIFKVNGKTVVVDRRDKVTVDGIMIYVQEVYPVNTGAKNSDRCEFMYSGIQEREESEIKQETIGENIVHFYFGNKKETEVREVLSEKAEEKENGDNTVVRINGYDVTGLTIGAERTNEEISAKTTVATEKKGIFAKLFSWIFG